MNVTNLLRRKAPECPTCRQPIVQPTPSFVAAGRLIFAAGGLAAAVLEYRKALKREAEQAQLAKVYDLGVDTPLDEHLEHRPAAPPAGYDGDWPPAHPSLDNETVIADADDDGPLP